MVIDDEKEYLENYKSSRKKCFQFGDGGGQQEGGPV